MSNENSQSKINENILDKTGIIEVYKENFLKEINILG
jgi:hypothetical protein